MSEWTDDFGNKLIGVHEAGTCFTEFCPIHNPSDHPMKHFEQRWSVSKHYMERVCYHGIGHPDPDDYKTKNIWVYHGCDGCCDPVDTGFEQD